MPGVLEGSTDFVDYNQQARVQYGCDRDYIIDLDWFVRRATNGQKNAFSGKVALIGCQGVAACAGKKNFEGCSERVQINIGATAAAQNPDFTILLGDNFYDDGISDANVDEQFRRAFVEPYASRGLKCFCVLGNHDYYIHSNSPWGGHRLNRIWGSIISPIKYHHSTPQMTLARGLRQVDLSYDATRNATGAWNMPFRYYALFSRIADFFVLDSNSFLFDKTQRDWFRRVYAASRAPEKILVMHHPYVSAGKRLGSMDDYSMYARAFGVDPESIDVTRTASGGDSRYGSGEVGRVISWWMNSNNMHFNYLFCAHDHILTVDSLITKRDKSGTTVQMISGGGGGPLATSNKEQHKINNIRKKNEESLGCFAHFIQPSYGCHVVDVSTNAFTVYDEHGGVLYTP